MISEPEVTEQTAHTVLNYCISRAVKNNTNLKFTVQIPYEAFEKSCGLSRAQLDEYFGSALEITATLKWVEHDVDTVGMDLIDEDEEQDNGTN